MSTLSLEHLIQKPRVQSDSKPPLLLLLHGYGSNEQDLFSFAPELPDNYFVISAKAPLPMQPYGNAWYTIHWDATDGKWSDDDEAIAARELISNFIDEAVAAYDLDATHVTLLGFSQGCILSYAVALTYPEKIKNIIGLSGYVNEAITKPKTDLSKYEHLSVFSSHGTVDQVIPVDAARKISAYLADLNIEVKLNEYPVGHGVAPQNFYDLKDWLLKHA
ncbi:alpha/beta hydrolase [Leeuwenhoekiella polynyae]|uniref:Phospholipase/carboxylesterase n=1 Tax=Leeuwenhoekiella polynyae TaxID=1550906 RepID=A0A4Q0P5I9_9FLAO|nr:alpha/beta fold hydrolase [Leeuwenhoekiella polynyae]RXG21306.1 phospholipase/carboxylesterase [Leeuwenhoekiella polynyae]